VNALPAPSALPSALPPAALEPPTSPSASTSHWELRRNCRLPPRRLALLCALPCAASVAIALLLSRLGYPLILAFAGLETLAMAIAFVAYARHATDHASLTLADGALQVDEVRGRQHRSTRLPAAWLQVEATPAGLWVRGGGVSVQLAGYAGRGDCMRVERELRRALRQQPLR
jgi:uncharacterized membrane protein